MKHIARRTFLKQTSALAAAGALGTNAFAAKQPLFKISLAQWSLNRHFFKRAKPHFDALDFAKIARENHIDGIEYVNQFFKDKAKDEAYLGDLKKRAADHNVTSVLIMVDGEGNLGEPEEAKRITAVENHHKWVEAAKFLGCHAIRVNARSHGILSYDEQMKLAADGLRRLCDFADKHDLNVLVENHGGLSSNGAWLAGVMKLTDHKRVGTLPDFGNFAIDRKKNEWYDRYQGVKELMPYAKAVSAKSHGWDSDSPWITTQGGGKETDFLKMMRIVLDAGYRGWVGIESEGGGNQMAGMIKTRDLLRRVRKKLTPEYT